MLSGLIAAAKRGETEGRRDARTEERMDGGMGAVCYKVIVFSPLRSGLMDCRWLCSAPVPPGLDANSTEKRSSPVMECTGAVKVQALL